MPPHSDPGLPLQLGGRFLSGSAPVCLTARLRCRCFSATVRTQCRSALVSGAQQSDWETTLHREVPCRPKHPPGPTPRYLDSIDCSPCLKLYL